MRTYITGLSLSHIPRNERGKHVKKLAAIVNQLSDENTRLNVNKIRETINYLMFDKIKDIRVSDTLNLKEVNSGKYGVNALMKHFNNSPNFLHSGYNQLMTISKGYLDRVNKVQQYIKFLYDNPLEFIKWILWGRSTWANQFLSKKWRISFFYVDRLMAGVHKKYFGDTLPCYSPDVNIDEFNTILSKFIDSFDAETAQQKVFLNRLKKINSIELDLSFIPLGWKNMKLWLDGNNFPRTYLSAFTQILSQVYLKHYMGMINTIYTAKIEELLTIPFQNDKKYRLPILMVSGPKYVIRRTNNKEAWKSMQEHGFFELEFKFLEDKWGDAGKVRVRASRKVRELFNKGVFLKTMIVMPPNGRNVNVHLVFSGKIENFIATKHLLEPLKVSKVDRIGIDINRRGKYAVVSNLELEIPKKINSINDSWSIVLEEIAKYQKLLETCKSWKSKLYSNEIEYLYRRKRNLRKSYHQKLANWVGQQLYHSDAKHLIIEDLNVNTINTRAALARAIESMADDTSLYSREVLAVNLMNKKCSLHKVSPYHTSTKHANCGGKLMRSSEQYDIAPCNSCNKMVNTHLNAAINLASSTIRGKI